MLVSRLGLIPALEELRHETYIGCDTETTGLMEDDCLFSLILSGSKNTFYFNFLEYPEMDPGNYLDRRETFQLLQELIFSDPKKTYFIHNAKFDARMLAKEGVEIAGRLHCSYAIERVLKNNYMDGKEPYGLDACARRRGLEKDGAVGDFIDEHKLWTEVRIPGKKKVVKLKHFDQVPSDVMIPYGIKDGHLHRTVGFSQLEQLRKLEAERPENFPSYMPIFENEIRLTKTLYRMEREGILISKPFVAKALEHEMSEVNLAKKQFLEATGEPFVDSNKPLALVFDKLGEKYPTTAKGNPSFAAEVLESMDSPVASMVNKIRYHEKRGGTYYSSFLHYADKHGVIHADARQAGTETARMSYRDPNLQNVPKEDEPEDQAQLYHVRESFIPKPGTFFYDVDYEQMEYRLMLEYAEQTDIIAQVIAGADLHQAMADLVGISRKHAKTLNFAVLYGAGPAKIAKMLKISIREAKQLRDLYFAKLPKVQNFIDSVIKAGRARGYIFNAYGRRNHIASKEWAYILPNHLIQGSCGDTVKIAMNRIDDMLLKKRARTKMLLQVHDELLFQFVPEETELIYDIQAIMEGVYPSRFGMKLTTSAAHSFKSWGYRDLVKGYAIGA